jgi:hypothetical protein
MLWRVSRPIKTRSKPPDFILPCQPALAVKNNICGKEFFIVSHGGIA